MSAQRWGTTCFVALLTLKVVQGSFHAENRAGEESSLQYRLEQAIDSYNLASSCSKSTFSRELSDHLVSTIAKAFQDASASETSFSAFLSELQWKPSIQEARAGFSRKAIGEGSEDSLDQSPLGESVRESHQRLHAAGSFGGALALKGTAPLPLQPEDSSPLEGPGGEPSDPMEAEVGAEGEDFLKIESTWTNVVLVAVCVVCAGLAAGLTMGLVSIDPLEMAIKDRSGTPEEKRQAKRILPLVTRHHYLLVTLLLFNSLANEALPIFLDNLVPAWMAVILSVSLVLFFGEILPSALFTGPNQMAIASGMAWFVYLLMSVLAPIAWPISWALDRILGIEGFKRYNRAEIGALVEVQHELSTNDEDVIEPPLHPDEVSIVNGVLKTAEKCVEEAMVTMDKVFCLSTNDRLGAETMADLLAAGFSRVPVYEGDDTRNIRGYLQVKRLIVVCPEDERFISSLVLRLPVVVSPRSSLLELMNTFQTGKSHLALVSHSPGHTLEALKNGVRLEGAARPVGIITLEDIIEEIIQEEIMDETDRMSLFIEQRAKKTLLRYTRRRRERRRFGRHATLGLNPAERDPSNRSLLKELSFKMKQTEPSGSATISASTRADSGRGGAGGRDGHSTNVATEWTSLLRQGSRRSSDTVPPSAPSTFQQSEKANGAQEYV